MHVKHLLSVLFLLFSGAYTFCQMSKGPLNSYSYALVQDSTLHPDSLIHNGVRAFRINDEVTLKSTLEACRRYLNNHSVVFLFLLDEMIQPSTDLLSEYPSVYQFHNLPWPTEKELVEQGKNIVLINSAEHVQAISDLTCPYDGKSFFVAMDVTDKQAEVTEIVEYWEENAKPVNFFSCRYEDLNIVNVVTQSLNEYNRIAGCFMADGKLIDGVRINSDTNFLQHTQFCFPFKEYIKIKTQKYGYELSPQYVLAHYSTDYVFSQIKATRIPLEIGVMASLNPSAKSAFPGIQEYSFQNNGVEKSKERSGAVYHFNGNAFFSFLPLPPSDSLLNLTVAARFRLTEDDLYHTLLSQGLTFILKVHRGYFCLTLPTRLDYWFSKVPVKTGGWYDLAVTIAEGRHVTLYRDGLPVDSAVIQLTRTSNDYFMIGNSTYQEYLKGDIAKMRIWNRVLSEEDISEIWVEKSDTYPLLLTLILLVLLLAALAYWFKFKKKTRVTTSKPLSVHSGLATVTPTFDRNYVQLFGSVAVVDAEATNLVDTMFPKTKSLFVLLVLKTIDASGITTREMNDALWPGMNENAAKNNRGVTILNLRQLLSRITNISLDYSDKRWRINGLETINVDYTVFKEKKSIVECR